jgi:hypothetical protein
MLSFGGSTSSPRARRKPVLNAALAQIAWLNHLNLIVEFSVQRLLGFSCEPPSMWAPVMRGDDYTHQHIYCHLSPD